MWCDNVKARLLTTENTYIKKRDGKAPVNSQQFFMTEAQANEKEILKPPKRTKTLLKKILSFFK